MKKTILKWSLLVIMLGYIVWISIWANGEAAQHTCKGVDIIIERNGVVDSLTMHGVEQELRRYGGEKIIGVPTHLVDTRKLRDHLASFNSFENVEVAMMANGRVKIHIVPMIPEMRVFDGNKSYYVNKDGKVSDSKADFFVDVPVVTGHFTNSFTPRDVLPLVRFIRQDQDLKSLTAMIHAEGPHDLIIVPRITGHVVNFGDTTRLDEKKKALMTMYRKVIPYKGWNEYDTISVKFKNQVVATRRIKPVAPVTTDIEEIDLEETTLPDVEPAPVNSQKKPENVSEE